MKKWIGHPYAWMKKKDGQIVCRACKQERTPEGHDPCLGTLPGVKFACCGHGKKYGYIAFENGMVLRADTLAPDRPAFA